MDEVEAAKEDKNKGDQLDGVLRDVLSWFGGRMSNTRILLI